jgi:hypothetical protein
MLELASTWSFFLFINVLCVFAANPLFRIRHLETLSRAYFSFWHDFFLFHFFFYFLCSLSSLVPLTLHTHRLNSPIQSFNYKSFLNHVDDGTPYMGTLLQFSGSLIFLQSRNKKPLTCFRFWMDYIYQVDLYTLSRIRSVSVLVIVNTDTRFMQPLCLCLSLFRI